MLKHGIKTNIYIVGGAAIALSMNNARVTTDIDANFSSPEIIAELQPLINEVAKEEGLTGHWLNDSFKAILGYFRKDDEPKTVFLGTNLVAAVASPQFVLSLKLAARRKKDIADIVAITKKLGLKSREELLSITKRFFMADLDAAAHQRIEIEEFIDQLIEEGLLQFPESRQSNL
jgi:hypothetical protein